MNAISPTTRTASPSGLVPRDFDQAVRLAEMMARSELVPHHLQRKPADCLLVIEQAMRWNMSPFAVAQGTFVTKGKLGFAGTLIHAAVEQNAPVLGHLSYEHEGEGENLAVTVRGTLIGETNPREVRVRLKDARTANEWWTRTPEQMLCYHGARVWARRHTPGVIFGVYSREELVDALEDLPLEPRAVPNTAVIADVPALTAPTWHSMSWPILSRDGTARDCGDVDSWEAEFSARVAHIEQHDRLSPDGKLDLLEAIRDANRAIFDFLRERGHVNVVEGVLGIFDEALGLEDVAA